MFRFISRSCRGDSHHENCTFSVRYVLPNDRLILSSCKIILRSELDLFLGLISSYNALTDLRGNMAFSEERRPSQISTVYSWLPQNERFEWKKWPCKIIWKIFVCLDFRLLQRCLFFFILFSIDLLLILLFLTSIWPTFFCILFVGVFF